ncbi:putative protein {ECO:0000313/EMBL:ADL58504,1} [Methanothermobacter wolfeii]|uniref:DUF4064 domain-containing protein n=1 Tax=Methanothermobacter wolfeii TaxID=145261 RepID=A0A9E7RUK6_METWO|nr:MULTISPECIES: DUF4064 domain-containing protein [Methanothermobacter]MDI6841635.1 DUF4064 domain-containing protein [Methanothermobacter wolfeii]NLM02390.1 DUF4064 domain-containing protein [Methanothermobacter wolfeii]QHN06358.1 DUF4064 domain-containing protein [Methanothermobacter sp. THM-1]UXH32560.1 DUF4064 domain-containing protein [Methanothermobacter wolfeii]SCM57110.1 putative protein {ECO:0000313/EMBL:ADL58504,1} [Methanothermobacter wolfeii]
MSETVEKSRTLELVLGIIGGVFGLLGGLAALVFSVFATDILWLGISAILASILGIVGSVYVRNNPRNGGVLLIVSAVWLLISISAFAIPGTVFLGLAGVLALLR